MNLHDLFVIGEDAKFFPPYSSMSWKPSGATNTTIEKEEGKSEQFNIKIGEGKIKNVNKGNYGYVFHSTCPK